MKEGNHVYVEDTTGNKIFPTMMMVEKSTKRYFSLDEYNKVIGTDAKKDHHKHLGNTVYGKGEK